MQPRSERNRGPVFTAAGVAILVAALLFGLTKTSDGETVAYMTSHERGRGMGPTSHTPHAPS